MDNFRQQYKEHQRQIRINSRHEIWKDIPWYEWKYQASDLWRVRSLKHNWPLLLSQWNSKWYRFVLLYNNWRKNVLVHRIVLATFRWLDLNDSSKFWCHKDDIPSNNRLDNLFIWTRMMNIDDMKSKWRWYYWLKNLYNQSKKIKIYQLSLYWEIINEWDSIYNASITLLIDRQSIWRCCRWKRKTAWWFMWSYNLKT